MIVVFGIAPTRQVLDGGLFQEEARLFLEFSSFASIDQCQPKTVYVHSLQASSTIVTKFAVN